MLDILEACPYHYHYLIIQIHNICTVYFTLVSGSVLCTLYMCTLCAHQGRQQWPGLTAHHCQAQGESAAGADTYKQTHHDPDPVVTMIISDLD